MKDVDGETVCSNCFYPIKKVMRIWVHDLESEIDMSESDQMLVINCKAKP